MILGELIDELGSEKVLVTYEEDGDEVVLYSGPADECPNEYDRCVVDCHVATRPHFISLMEVNE